MFLQQNKFPPIGAKHALCQNLHEQSRNMRMANFIPGAIFLTGDARKKNYMVIRINKKKLCTGMGSAFSTLYNTDFPKPIFTLPLWSPLTSFPCQQGHRLSSHVTMSTKRPQQEEQLFQPARISHFVKYNWNWDHQRSQDQDNVVANQCVLLSLERLDILRLTNIKPPVAWDHQNYHKRKNSIKRGTQKKDTKLLKWKERVYSTVTSHISLFPSLTDQSKTYCGTVLSY